MPLPDIVGCALGVVAMHPIICIWFMLSCAYVSAEHGLDEFQHNKRSWRDDREAAIVHSNPSDSASQVARAARLSAMPALEQDGLCMQDTDPVVQEHPACDDFQQTMTTTSCWWPVFSHLMCLLLGLFCGLNASVRISDAAPAPSAALVPWLQKQPAASSNSSAPSMAAADAESCISMAMPTSTVSQPIVSPANSICPEPFYMSLATDSCRSSTIMIASDLQLQCEDAGMEISANRSVITPVAASASATPADVEASSTAGISAWTCSTPSTAAEWAAWGHNCAAHLPCSAHQSDSCAPRNVQDLSSEGRHLEGNEHDLGGQQPSSSFHPTHDRTSTAAEPHAEALQPAAGDSVVHDTAAGASHIPCASSAAGSPAVPYQPGRCDQVDQDSTHSPAISHPCHSAGTLSEEGGHLISHQHAWEDRHRDHQVQRPCAGQELMPAPAVASFNVNVQLNDAALARLMQPVWAISR